MEVEAQVWYWTPAGMRRKPNSPVGNPVRYIEASEAERLLEEAHRRGFEDAKNESKNLPRF